MAVCSFLGGNVYESDLYSRILGALEDIAAKNDTIEFLLLYHDYVPQEFMSLCGKAAMELRSKYSEKVIITCVKDSNDLCCTNSFIYSRKKPWPSYSDKTIMPDIPNVKVDNSITRYGQYRRWIIEQSTHLVSYVYEKFFDSERKFFRIAKRRDDLEIIDLTSIATMQTINKGILTLSDRNRLICQELDEGYAYKEIAAQLGVCSERVRQLETHIGGKLRKYVCSKIGSKLQSGSK